MVPEDSGKLGRAKEGIAETERMFKALITSLEKKHFHLFKAKAAILWDHTCSLKHDSLALPQLTTTNREMIDNL